jgi:predicted acyltransferase
LHNKSDFDQFKLAFFRSLKLFLLGMLTQAGTSFPTYDLKHIRIMGILQRVSLCYLTVATVEIVSPLEPSQYADFNENTARWHLHIGLIYNFIRYRLSGVS